MIYPIYVICNAMHFLHPGILNTMNLQGEDVILFLYYVQCTYMLSNTNICIYCSAYVYLRCKLNKLKYMDVFAFTVALAWLHSQGDDVIPIPGTTNIGHLDENLAAMSIKV